MQKEHRKTRENGLDTQLLELDSGERTYITG